MYLYIINDRSQQCQTSLLMPAGAVGSQHQHHFDRNSARPSNIPEGLHCEEWRGRGGGKGRKARKWEGLVESDLASSGTDI